MHILELRDAKYSFLLTLVDLLHWEQVLDPRAAVKDSDKLLSDSVKKDIDTLMTYRSNLKDIAAILVSKK